MDSVKLAEEIMQQEEMSPEVCALPFQNAYSLFTATGADGILTEPRRGEAQSRANLE